MSIHKGKTLPKICPRCGNMYDDYPALSRTDNRTEICPVCGVEEALIAAGIPGNMRDEIVRKVKELSSGVIRPVTASHNDIQRLRNEYPSGTRVVLKAMDDPQAPPAGTKGTAIGVDDTGSVMVQWDNGSHLNVLYGVDRIEKDS